MCCVLGLAKEDFAPVDSTPTPTPDDVFSQTVQSDHITGGFGRMLAANSVSQVCVLILDV